MRIFLSAYVLFLWAALTPYFSTLRAEQPENGTPDKVKSFPWYDSQKDTYKDYTAEDLAPFLKKPKANAPPAFGIPDLSILLYGALALAAGIVLYLLVQYFRNRGSESVESSSKAPVVTLGDIPEPIPTEEEDLEKKIDELLRLGDYRRACMLMFLLLLRKLQTAELIVWHEHQTAREILEAMKGDSGLASDLIQKAADLFELCAYTTIQPDTSSILDLKRQIFNFSPPERRPAELDHQQ